MTVVHQEIADLLGGPRPIRVRDHPGDVQLRLPASITNRQYRCRSVTAQSPRT
jgi:hypothetical protein